MKLLEKLRKDRRVRDVCVESGMARRRASYFVHLRVGYRFGDAHCFGEDTLTDVRRTLRAVELCDCGECNATDEEIEEEI